MQKQSFGMRFAAVSLFLFAAMFTFADTVYVDANAASGGDGSAGAPYATLQAAADAASSGDTISATVGDYAGDVDFGSKTITGDIASGTVKIDGNLSSQGTYFKKTGAGTLLLNGSNDIKYLQLFDSGATIIDSPLASSGTTNYLNLGRLWVTNGATFTASNSDVKVTGSNTTYFFSPTTIEFVGGSYSNATSVQFAYETKKSSSTLVFDGTKVKIAGTSLSAGQSSSAGGNVANIIITNDADVTVKELRLRNGDVHQYSGKVLLTGSSDYILSLGYSQGGTINYYLHGGTLTQNDSTWNSGGAVCIGGGYKQSGNGDIFSCQGYLYIYEGAKATFNAPTCYIGRQARTNSVATANAGYLYVRGGEFAFEKANGTVHVGYQGNGTLEVSEGGYMNVNGDVYALSAPTGNAKTATISLLSGGELRARRLCCMGARTKDTSTLILDGGKARVNNTVTQGSSDFVYGFKNAYVGTGGVIFNTEARTLTIPQSFTARTGQSAPSASSPAELAALPAFTKIGTGTLTLTGTNDWLCATCVSNGTLVVGDRALPATTLRLGGGTIDLGGNTHTVANLIGSGTVKNGTLVVTGTVWPGYGDSGELRIASTATLTMTTIGCSVAEDGTCGKLVVTGTQNVDGLVVVGEGFENRVGRKGLKLIEATAVSGSPATVAVGGLPVSVGAKDLQIGKGGTVFIIK